MKEGVLTVNVKLLAEQIRLVGKLIDEVDWSKRKKGWIEKAQLEGVEQMLSDIKRGMVKRDVYTSGQVGA